MSKKHPLIACLLVWGVGTAGFAVILSWCRQEAGVSISGQGTALLVQSCGFVALCALFVEACWRGTIGFGRVLLGFVLALVTASTVGCWMLGSMVEGLDWSTLGRWHLLQALPLLALAIGRRLVTPIGTLGLEILLGGSLLLMLPFMLDGYLIRAQDPEQSRLVVSYAIGLSPWPMGCHEFLNLDIFKAERMYRAFRIGERIYQYPTWNEAARIQASLGAILVGLSLVLALFRRLARRLWTPTV